MERSKDVPKVLFSDWIMCYGSLMQCLRILGWIHHYKILRSSSQSGWRLRNIHISNNNGSFTFYVDIVFPLSLPRLFQTWLYIWVTQRMSYKKQTNDVLLCVFMLWVPVWFMVFIATFNNFSVKLWRSALLVEETGENHRPVISHWQTLSRNVVSSTPRHERGSNSYLLLR